MKLIVQVPCYNEEKTLPSVINSIPKSIPGIDKIETLIIDDGSSDKTVQVARELGVTHIIRNRQNQGLARTFATGIHECLKHGADIIVNTDGDNQYPQKDIPKLIKPILDKEYDIVVADRQIKSIEHFSPLKKFFQTTGSRVVNLASGTDIPDAPSGFRAYSRHAAMSLNIITDFSYCMETIISAGRRRIAITHVPVNTNPKTRESRLFNNILQHMMKSGGAILRSYTMYRPMQVFLATGISTILIGTIPYIRFLWLMFPDGEPVSGHLQSLLFGAIFIFLGVMFLVIGIVADLLSINRRLLEDTLYRLKKAEYDGGMSVKLEK